MRERMPAPSSSKLSWGCDVRFSNLPPHERNVSVPLQADIDGRGFFKREPKDGCGQAQESLDPAKLL